MPHEKASREWSFSSASVCQGVLGTDSKSSHRAVLRTGLAQAFARRGWLEQSVHEPELFFARQAQVLMLVNDALCRLLGTGDYKLTEGSRRKQGGLLKQRFLFMGDTRFKARAACQLACI